jgi:hypothetical protein
VNQGAMSWSVFMRSELVNDWFKLYSRVSSSQA